MEAGYDYLLFRRDYSRVKLWISAIVLLCVGITALGGSGAYYTYKNQVSSTLTELNANMVIEPDKSVPTITNYDNITEDISSKPKSPPGLSVGDIQNLVFNSGDNINAPGWVDPMTYAPINTDATTLIENFYPIDSTQAMPLGTQKPANRIKIPALSINSPVKELSILNTAKGLKYENPTQSIGHLYNTANAGELGSSWFFGHLESPVAGDGSVFYHLPRIADLIKQGKEVFIITENDHTQFLYKITSTQILKAEDLRLHDSGKASIHLVTCIPRLIYDHRLIATGKLVGFK